jgi:hypothetical protein
MLSRFKTVRNLAVAVSALVASGLLAGCGTGTVDTSSEAPAKPGDITPAQALAAVQAYDRGNNRVNKTFDAAGIAHLETVPLSTSSQAFMKIDQELRQPIPVISNTDPKFVIPAQSGYPRWFLSISRRMVGAVPSPQPTYTIFTQKSKSAPFLAAYELTPTDQEQIPSLALAHNGAASAVTSGKELVIPPADLGKEITDHYVKDLAGKDDFETSETLDNQLGAGYNLGVKALQNEGVSLSRSVDYNIPQRYALGTSDGGALVFSAVEVKDQLKSVKSGSLATLRSGSNDAALLGKPVGATAKHFTIVRLEMFMTYIPTTASNAKAKVMAYSETGISIR